MAAKPKNSQAMLRRAIIVCALGYFVDVFDIQVFTALRVPSLTDIGISGDKLSTVSGLILNSQMTGMILGAFLWGWLGDRFGRLKTLYGSMLIYSLGTIACAFIHDPYTYALCRFVTGFGLAGEQGGAATLIAEMMTPSKRGWGFAAIGGLGFLGPIAASTVSLYLPWRQTYIVGGLLGIALFILRMNLMEPELFLKAEKFEPKRGSLRHLLRRRTLTIFLCCFVFGLPEIFNAFVISFFSTEFAHAVLLPGETFDQRISLLLFFLGISWGSAMNNAISQIWKSRRRALGTALAGSAAVVGAFLLLGPLVKMSAFTLYGIYFVLGVVTGGQVIITMVVAEQFGTNIRATATIALFNFMRGAIIPMLLIFEFLRRTLDINIAAATICVVLYSAALVAFRRLPETYGRNLDYIEIPNPAGRK